MKSSRPLITSGGTRQRGTKLITAISGRTFIQGIPPATSTLALKRRVDRSEYRPVLGIPEIQDDREILDTVEVLWLYPAGMLEI